MTKSGRVLSGKPVVFSIPIDFCIEFWNSTFSPVLEFTEGIFLTASARAFQWCKPRMRSCFRSKVIQVFLAANSTWTYHYSLFIYMDVRMSFCTLTLRIFVFAPRSTPSQTSLNRILRFSDHYPYHLRN